MKFIGLIAVSSLALATFSAWADEADLLLERSKSLQSMEYKRDQLKLQAEMAESYKKMSDSGLIVDADGNPLGVDNIQMLGEEVRQHGRASAAANPFEAGGAPGVAPNGMPFLLDQPAMNNSLTPPPAQPGLVQPPAAPQPPKVEEEKEEKEEAPKLLKLVKVGGDSVVIRTDEGDQVKRVGEKVYDKTLVSFSVDKAYLKGPKGTEVISIDWSSKKR